MILKSHITITKAEYVNNTSPNCQLIVKGIVPSLQVDLCTDHYDNLTILGTIESHSNKLSTGPVAVALGMDMHIILYKDTYAYLHSFVYFC